MPSELATALAAFQEELPEITKGAKGKIEGVSEKTGKQFSFAYDYADLGPMSNVVLRLLGKHGLAWTAKPTVTEQGFMLHYALKHGASGETDEGDWPLPDPARFDIKKLGGVITYARRYCLMAVTGVAPVGDDQDAQGLDGVTAAAPRRGPERYTGWDRPHDDSGRVKVPVTGPDHERLRHEPPTDGLWDGEDHWVDQPPGDAGITPAKTAPRGSRKLSPAQAIAVHFKRLGVTDDTERLIKTTILAERAEPLEHTSDLDEAKPREISNQLAKLPDRAALDTLLATKRAEVPS